MDSSSEEEGSSSESSDEEDEGSGSEEGDPDLEGKYRTELVSKISRAKQPARSKIPPTGFNFATGAGTRLTVKAPEIISITGWNVVDSGGIVGVVVNLSWGSGYHGTCTEVVNVTKKTGCFASMPVHASNQFELRNGTSNDQHGAPLDELTAPGIYEADQLFIFMLGNKAIPNSGFKIRREVTQVNSGLRLVVIVEPYDVYNVPYGGGSYNAQAGGGNRISWIKDL